ncbi:MAG: hypothetical protein RL385_255 [Pseudomonadota bacterium]
MERSSSAGTWRQIGGPAKRIAPSANDQTCMGQP